MIEMKDIPIFLYGENPNGYVIEESEVLDFEKFKNVAIIKRNYIDGFGNLQETTVLIGIILEATRVEFPYVYGDIIVFDEGLSFSAFKNYEVKYESIRQDGKAYLVGISILAIELE